MEHFLHLCFLLCMVSSSCRTGEAALSTLRNFAASSPSDMQLHIKRVLNITFLNESQADKYVMAQFPLYNPNPRYVFVLPDMTIQNRTITLRRSDFISATYPNISYAKRFFKKKQFITSLDAFEKYPMEEVEFVMLNEIKTRKLFDNHRYAADDVEDLDIVGENVRTERNFVRMIEEINDHPESFTSNPNHGETPGHLQPGNVDWNVLGLQGWSGGLSRGKAGDVKSIASVSLESHLPDIPRPVVQRPNVNTNLNHNNLEQMLAVERLVYQNFTGAHETQIPKYPVTTIRNLHHDEDVFIARANDPFGHSTKWLRSNGSRDGRSKRGAVQLYSMIKCATGCDPIIYKGYGCYCGFLGSGKMLDGIDRCCAIHDYCYSVSSCPAFLEYFVPYLWKCYKGRPLCAIDHGEWGGPSSCAARLCECDRVLSKCLRRYYCPQKRALCRTSPIRVLQHFLTEF